MVNQSGVEHMFLTNPPVTKVSVIHAVTPKRSLCFNITRPSGIRFENLQEVLIRPPDNPNGMEHNYFFDQAVGAQYTKLSWTNAGKDTDLRNGTGHRARELQIEVKVSCTVARIMRKRILFSSMRPGGTKWLRHAPELILHKEENLNLGDEAHPTSFVSTHRKRTSQF
jgi:hypothetical protein